MGCYRACENIWDEGSWETVVLQPFYIISVSVSISVYRHFRIFYLSIYSSCYLPVHVPVGRLDSNCGCICDINDRWKSCLAKHGLDRSIPGSMFYVMQGGHVCFI